MSATPPPPQVQIQVDWVESEYDRLPIMASNLVMIQQTPHEFIITFGVAAPPFTTTPLTQEEASKTKIVPQPIVRLALAPGRVVELMQLLQQQLMAYQQTQKH